jgi:hypothetical protein
MFKNLVRTSKKVQHVIITKINWLNLFKKIKAVFIENHTDTINKECEINSY